MNLECSVVSVKTSKDAKSVRLEVKVGSENRIYSVSEGTYREIGCPLSGDFIDGDTLVGIEAESRRKAALAKASRILAFADNNRRNLYRKLIQAGFSRDESRFAVSECVSLGFIDESAQIRRIIEKMANGDLIGPYKIRMKLISKGYEPKDISAVLDELTASGEVSFTENKKALLERLMPESFEEKQKILYKYGYRG